MTDTNNTVSDADWLEEAARYFENRDTGGEDMAFWANVSNAERCRSIAQSLRASIPGGVGVKVAQELGDPTEEMIAAGLRVDLSNEDELAAVINLWHAMAAAAPSNLVISDKSDAVVLMQIAARAEAARPAAFHETLKWIAKTARSALKENAL